MSRAVHVCRRMPCEEYECGGCLQAFSYESALHDQSRTHKVSRCRPYTKQERKEVSTMTATLAGPKPEQTARPNDNRRIVYLRGSRDQMPSDIVDCRIVCTRHCACARKKKKR